MEKPRACAVPRWPILQPVFLKCHIEANMVVESAGDG